MALTSYPLQDGFETTLSQALTSTDTTAYVNSVGNFTVPGSITTYAVINPGKSNVEVVEINASDSSALTFTIANRNIDQGASVTTTAQSHAVGSKVIISDNYQFWKDIVDEVDGKPGLADNNTWTGTNTFQGTTTFEEEVDFSGTTIAGLKVNNLTTAERTALTGSNGMIVYDTDLGQNYQYVGGAWVAVGDTGTPDASTTVAGKVEEATNAEVIAGTATGDTGAQLFLNPATTIVAEAMTFFNNTDATGAEMETLTDGSEAEGLHYHEAHSLNVIGREEYDIAEYGAAFASGGTTTNNGLTWALTTQAADNRSASVSVVVKDVVGAVTSCHDKNPSFRAVAKYDSATAQEGFIGFASSGITGAPQTVLEGGVMTIDHFGFIIHNGDVTISVADGTTQSSTSITCTVTDLNDFAATFDGTTATFYLNGTNVGTRTSNVPDGNLTYYSIMVGSDSSAAAKTMYAKKTSVAFVDNM